MILRYVEQKVRGQQCGKLITSQAEMIIVSEKRSFNFEINILQSAKDH